MTGGDLYRACGEPRRTKPDLLLAVDALDVILDDTARRVAVAHVVVTRGWWRGPFTAVCNTDSVGEWNLAPRAHPNDGRADVIEVVPEMSLRARWQARRRLPLGTHVPHPQITTRSAREVTLDFGRPVPVRIDGRSAGTARHVAVRVRPDAFDLLV